MKITRCDNCNKESKYKSNEFEDDFLPISLGVKEPEGIHKKRVEYVNTVLKGDLGDVPYKRTKHFEFCCVECLINFVNTKIKSVFDDWKESVDSYRTEN